MVLVSVKDGISFGVPLIFSREKYVILGKKLFFLDVIVRAS